MTNFTPMPTRRPPQPKTYPVAALRKPWTSSKASAVMFMSRKGMAKGATK